MANLNKVMLIGRLTRDPELVPFEKTGGKVAKFGFAVNNRKPNQSTGQWEDVPVFLDVEAFNRGENGKQADRVKETLRKGQQIFIEGHLRMDQWEKDGQKRSKLVVVVDNFQYLEPRAEGQGESMGRSESTARSQRTATTQRRAEPGYSSGGQSYGGEFEDESEPMERSSRGSAPDEEDIPF